jgi:glycosyltransferase involved in cell wall biosynthesis
LPALILLLRPLLARLWRRPVPVILYAAQNIVKRYPWPFRWFEDYCFRRADMILPCGELVAATLRAKGYRGPLRVIPLPSDPAVFAPDPAARCRGRQALGLPAEVPLIGYGGKLAEEKGIAVLLEAFAALPGGQQRLLLVGGGPLRPALETQARAAGVAERVLFAGGVSHAALVDYLNAADVWVVPSLTRANWREQFGRVAVEAMACGRPVVGSASGEIPRVLDGAGYVVPEGDPAALTAALAALLADPARRAALGAAARARACACYTPAAVARLYASAYDEVMSDEQ